MLGSTLLSAATALFFLPAVFSAPIAPATSVSVPEVETTTITTTKGVAIQKVTAVFVEKKSQLDALYADFVNVDASKLDTNALAAILGHTTDILHDTVHGVQAACTSIDDGVEVEVEISGLIGAVCGLVATVICILGRVLKIVGVVTDAISPLIATVLLAVLRVLQVVVKLVPTILALVGKVLMKVDALVPTIKDLVALNLGGITSIVALLRYDLI